MKIEFHYYITHLIAARAGIRGEPLRILAHTSQLTDDNDTVYPIRDGRKALYWNRISQTLHPLKSHRARLDVYPLFHFIPGEPHAPYAARADGLTNPFNTTPNSPNANRIIDATLATNDYYQIGIACHAYVDTWAHQNFVGFRSDFNRFSGFWDPLIPNIGHADAKTKPDHPRLIWEDERLTARSVNNKARFLEAAFHLYAKLTRLASPASTDFEADRQSLLQDLDTAIGDAPERDGARDGKIDGYRLLAGQSAYGGTAIPEYNPKEWFHGAIKTSYRRVGRLGRGGRTEKIYTFKPGHETSDWYKFQQAVVEYADRTKAILCENPEIAKQYTT